MCLLWWLRFNFEDTSDACADAASMAFSSSLISSCQAPGSLVFQLAAIAFSFATISSGEVGTAVLMGMPACDGDWDSVTVEAADAVLLCIGVVLIAVEKAVAADELGTLALAVLRLD